MTYMTLYLFRIGVTEIMPLIPLFVRFGVHIVIRRSTALIYRTNFMFFYACTYEFVLLILSRIDYSGSM